MDAEDLAGSVEIQDRVTEALGHMVQRRTSSGLDMAARMLSPEARVVKVRVVVAIVTGRHGGTMESQEPLLVELRIVGEEVRRRLRVAALDCVLWVVGERIQLDLESIDADGVVVGIAVVVAAARSGVVAEGWVQHVGDGRRHVAREPQRERESRSKKSLFFVRCAASTLAALTTNYRMTGPLELQE